MLSILASGTLISDPVSRTTAAGKPYATCTMRTPCEESEAVLTSCIAFAGDAVAALLALSRGDSCAVAGRAKLTSWTKDGEQKHGLSVVADKVLTVYQIEKKRRQASQPETVAA